MNDETSKSNSVRIECCRTRPLSIHWPYNPDRIWWYVSSVFRPTAPTSLEEMVSTRKLFSKAYWSGDVR